MNSDPISNLISILHNGYNISASRVFISYSRSKERILNVLAEEEYIKNVRLIERNGKKVLAVRLKYENDMPAISFIKRISKPGRRLYAKPSQFRPVLPMSKKNIDMGLTIISTPKGVMSTRQARKQNVGGELILKVY